MIIKIYTKIVKFFKLSIYKICFRKRFKHKKINFRKSFIIRIEKNGSIFIGDNCFFNNYCSLNSLSLIKIGNDCIFGERVSIYDHNHNFNKGGLIIEQGFKIEQVIIGNNCWIGSGVVILAGSTIGDNVVIGAGITISGVIPSNSVVKRSKESYFIEKLNG